MKFLQRTRDSQSNSVEILKDLDHIEMAPTQMEQHLGEIIAYAKDVIVGCWIYAIYILDMLNGYCYVYTLRNYIYKCFGKAHVA